MRGTPHLLAPAPIRALFVLFLLAAWCPQAAAQIVRIYLSNPSVVKRLKDKAVDFQGQKVVIGEVKAGIFLNENGVNYMTGGKAVNEVFAIDPSDPTNVPYKFKKGERKVKSRKRVVALSGDEIDFIAIMDRRQTLQGIAEEYRYRLSRLEGLEQKRKANKKGTAQWFADHAELLADYDRLLNWLRSGGFSGAVKKVQRRVAKESKVVAKDAAAARHKEALTSIHDVEVPTELAEAAREISGGAHTFAVQESQHFRIVYKTSVPHDVIKLSLKMAERMLDGFRVSFLDPWVGPDYFDRLPDGLFAEIYLGPEDLTFHECFLEDYYDLRWGQNKPTTTPDFPKGKTFWRGDEPRFLAYWLLGEWADVEGIVAHMVGHVIYLNHYKQGGTGGNQEWIMEGLSYYLGIEYLGRNSVHCIGKKTDKYYQPEQKHGEKDLQSQGTRPNLIALAVQKGPTVDALALKTMYEISDVDLAKSWALYQFVVDELGKEGQLWLRAACEARRRNKGFMTHWRTASEKLFDISGEDVFQVLEKRWRKHADEQLKGTSK